MNHSGSVGVPRKHSVPDDGMGFDCSTFLRSDLEDEMGPGRPARLLRGCALVAPGSIPASSAVLARP